MSSNLVITDALRSTLQNIKRAAGNKAVVSKQPESFQSTDVQDINDVRINPSALTDRAKEFQSRLDRIEGNIELIENAQEQAVKIEGLVRDADQIVGDALKSLAAQSASGGKLSAEVLEDFSARFNTVLDKIDQAAGPEEVPSILRGASVETVFIDRPGTSMITQGSDLSAQGLGLDRVDFQSVDDIAATFNNLRSAIEGVRGFTTALKIDSSEIKTKQSFAQGTVGSLQDGVQNLDNIGQTEEGANLLALQTSQELAESDVALVSEGNEDLLKLF